MAHETKSSRAFPFWARHGDTIMGLAIAGMAIIAAVWLGYEFFRLLARPERVAWHKVVRGGIDLSLRQREIAYWFQGKPIYGILGEAVYPPATYVILWPLLGWLSRTGARWLWAGTSLLALAWLIRVLQRESLATSRRERIFWALVPLSMYATGATIGNGQLALLIEPLILASLLLLRDRAPAWRRDLMVALFMSVALIKPNLSAPFVWLLVFCRGPLRPLLLLAGLYGSLTLIATLFQPGSPVSVVYAWLAWGGQISSVVEHQFSQSNLHDWMARLNLPRMTTPASLLVLLALGLWIRRHRAVDLWILTGVTGLVARLWMYHNWYDDLLILPALVALYRLAKQDGMADQPSKAGPLFAVLLLVMLAPGGQFLLPSPWNFAYSNVQAVIWLAVLAYLVLRARRARAQGQSAFHEPSACRTRQTSTQPQTAAPT